jgi:DnaK suppressor protein
MDPSDLQRYHRLLLEKQHELSSAQGEAQSRVPTAGGMHGDYMDEATANSEAELQIRLHKSDGRLLKAIEDALLRIRRGTYGVCVVCKQPISEARLEAVPWTHRVQLTSHIRLDCFRFADKRTLRVCGHEY